MKILQSCFTLLCLPLLLYNTVASSEEHQAELDRACEQARKAKIQPLRKKHIENCVNKENKEREYCERFYRDFGARTGKKAPLFYDLPECVKAFEYKKHN
ncbi:hypothetical protein [Zooshikella harenae]|uniref:Uncharacterized protein n=1 Tax=Zooshikella harenae TaxID=2827238 RepID=A0ABS5ZK37_9GAMM|nr:hypothetical protein [Zooshikella harenae]MBU2713596.1 hypothetical protein [Zooshikella harenae]